MATYMGHENIGAGGAPVTVDGELLDPRYDLRNHSPDGFQWGYGGSGPAQLALAILADHCNRERWPRADEFAETNYQAFKWSVVAKFPSGKAWTLTTEDIDRWFEGKCHSYDR